MDLKDARGHEYEKGERVKDRKFTNRVDARPTERIGNGGTRSHRAKSGLTRFRGRAV